MTVRLCRSDSFVTNPSKHQRARRSHPPVVCHLLPPFPSYHVATLIMASNAAAAMDIDEAAIDEGLYSRQL